MKNVAKYVNFKVGNIEYRIDFRNDYEIVFSRVTSFLDHMKKPIDDYERYPLKNPNEAIIVYRRIIKEVEKWIHEERPPMIKWSSGYDDSRISLYDNLSKKLESNGYLLVKNGISCYYAYKVNE